MRILYLHGNRLDSESANVVQVINMCEAFAQCGVDVTLAIAAPQHNSINIDNYLKRFLDSRPSFKIITYKKYTVAKRFNMLGVMFACKKIIKQNNADICFTRSPFLLQQAKSLNRSIIFESHSNLLHNKSKILSRLWEMNLIKSSKSNNMLKFVTISNSLASFWQSKGVPDKKLTPLHDGFNAGKFSKQKSIDEARNITNLPLGKKVVLYSGRLHLDREPDQILKLAKIFSDVLFVVLGGPEEQRLKLEQKSQYLNINNIIWKGHVPHSSIPDYLYAADVLLMIWSWNVPHINHFSPLKMFEYMASGRIIVGQAFPTIHEVLTDGVTAYLADPDSFENLTTKLSEALAHEYPLPMAEQARELAFSQYSWKTRAEKILNGIEKLL